ncbi:DUF2330 domain-containing protein [Candidatus Uhrbacteria bacterium]|nr:DUF2330 domain-containing protein [Candidatus Uhrbacteria bacterium]
MQHVTRHVQFPMRSRCIAIATLLTLLTPFLAQACAIAPFTESGDVVQPTGRTRLLVAWSADLAAQETFVVHPELQGTADRFGLVFGFPARPTISEPPKQLFDVLAARTRPLPPPKPETSFFDGATGAAPPSATSIQVIEERVVGDLHVTILSATHGRALEQWLRARKFTVNAQDRKNIAYYLQSPGAHFAALELTARAQQRQKPCNPEMPRYAQPGCRSEALPLDTPPVAQSYDLRPIAFTFAAPRAPILPLRFAADDDVAQPVTLYTIGREPLIIPGAALAFSGRVHTEVTATNDPLHTLATPDDWLLRLELKIDPQKITRDPQLVPWMDAITIRPTTDDALRILAPEATPTNSGIMRLTAGEMRAVDDAPEILELPPNPLVTPPSGSRTWPSLVAQHMLRFPLLFFAIAPFIEN